MSVIQSNDCVIQAKLADNYVTIYCVKSFQMESTTAEKEITNETDGKYKDYDYHDITYKVTLETVLAMQDGSTPVTFDFSYYQQSFLNVELRIIYYQGIKLKAVTFTGIVLSVTEGATANEVSGGNVTILVKGQPIYEDSLPETVNLTLIMSGQDTAIGLAKFRLLNTDSEIIFQSDTLPQASGGNLANPFNITTVIPKGFYYYHIIVDVESINNEFDLTASPGKSTPFNAGPFEENSVGSQLYDFNSDAVAEFTLGIPTPPPTCVSPTAGDLTSTSATAGVPFIASLIVTGSTPFNLTSITKPTWLAIAVSGNTISFSGTPAISDIGTSDLNFTINNACGNFSISTAIDVASNPDLVPVNYSFDLTGTGSVMRIYVNGTLVDTLSTTSSGSINVSPGDAVEAQVIGSFGSHKVLSVSSNTRGSLYSHTTLTGVSDHYYFTTVSGETITISGQYF